MLAFGGPTPLRKSSACLCGCATLIQIALKSTMPMATRLKIAAVVVWKVLSPSSALFDVDSYEDFVHIQSETAVRSLSSHYPYDNGDGPGLSLRGNPEEVSETLQKELEDRLKDAGVRVIEARLSHLAYSP